MPARALYYPEWSIGDPVFLAESLLYWDRLAVIVPEPHFFGGVWHADDRIRGLFADLHKEFVTPIVPTEAQKLRVHGRVAALFARDAPEWFQPRALQPTRFTTLAADKFAPETIEMLTHHQWTRRAEARGDLSTYHVSLAAANVVMAALADECSSAQMPPITRDPGGFVAACNSLLQLLAAPQGLTLGDRVGAAVARPIETDLAFLLASVPHVGLGPEPTAGDLERVIKARRNPDVEALRTTFVAKVDAYLTTLRSAEGGERNIVRDQFLHEMNTALAKLKRELVRVGLGTLLSKEGLCALVAGVVVSAVATPAVGLAIGLGAGLVEYRQKRREVLEKNWASWAFDVGQGMITLV